MGVVVWIVVFAGLSAVCAWVVFGAGAESAAGLLAALLAGADIVNWSEGGIRLFMGLTWLLLAVWFVIGLFVPEARVGL
jgi:hypothetical protein